MQSALSPSPSLTTSHYALSLPQSVQTRALHATRRQENLVVGGLVVAGSALALQYGLKVGRVRERHVGVWRESIWEDACFCWPLRTSMRLRFRFNHTTLQQAYGQWKEKKAAEAAAGGGTAEGGEGGGGLAGGMSSLFAKRFYEGGFEDKMTRREAALILGVRYVCLEAQCTFFGGGKGFARRENAHPTAQPPQPPKLKPEKAPTRSG